MVKTRSRKRIARRKSVRGGDDSLEARLAAATAKREKADRELAATQAVADEKAEDDEGDDDNAPTVDKNFFASRMRKDKPFGRQEGTSRSRRSRRSRRGGDDPPPPPPGGLTLRVPPPKPPPTLRNPEGKEFVRKPVNPNVLAGLAQFKSTRASGRRRTRRRHPRRKTSRRKQ